MYRSSPFRSTLNTGYITGLGMCKVCTEAVHCVALWTRVTLGLGMCPCQVCTEARDATKNAKKKSPKAKTRPGKKGTKARRGCVSGSANVPVCGYIYIYILILGCINPGSLPSFDDVVETWRWHLANISDKEEGKLSHQIVKWVKCHSQNTYRVHSWLKFDQICLQPWWWLSFFFSGDKVKQYPSWFLDIQLRTYYPSTSIDPSIHSFICTQDLCQCVCVCILGYDWLHYTAGSLDIIVHKQIQLPHQHMEPSFQRI